MGDRGLPSKLSTPPPRVLTRAKFWFRGRTCGKTGSPFWTNPWYPAAQTTGHMLQTEANLSKHERGRMGKATRSGGGRTLLLMTPVRSEGSFADQSCGPSTSDSGESPEAGGDRPEGGRQGVPLRGAAPGLQSSQSSSTWIGSQSTMCPFFLAQTSACLVSARSDGPDLRGR